MNSTNEPSRETVEGKGHSGCQSELTARHTRLEDPASIVDSYWDHNDVLLLALAYLPPNIERLSADAVRWHQVVAGVVDRYSKQAPELFEEVHFERRPGSPPYSEELDEFFKQAGLGGQLQAVNPAYQVFELPQEAKDDIRETEEPLLKKYVGVIKKISEDLAALAVESGALER